MLWRRTATADRVQRERQRQKKIPLFKETVAKQAFKYKKFKYNLEILQNKKEIKRFNLQGYQKR